MKKEKLTHLFKSTFLFLSLLMVLGTVDLQTQTACAINSTITDFTQATPTVIPTGPGVVTSTLIVAGAPTNIVELELTTFLAHTFAADLDVTLMSPAGTISSRRGG